MSAHQRWTQITRWPAALMALAVVLAVTGCTVVMAADGEAIARHSDGPPADSTDPAGGATGSRAAPVSAELASLLTVTPAAPVEPEAVAPAPVDTAAVAGVPEGALELATEPVDSWKAAARLVIDDQFLADAFTAAGYRLPSGSEVYLVEIIDGIDQPAYLLYEAGGGAFSTEFWPASTVKLLAAVAAVEYVGDLGFTGDAVVAIGSASERTLSSIYEAAITVSSNGAYDRLLQIAGLDYVNGEFLSAYGLDSMQYGSSYSGLSVTRSPQLTLTEGQVLPGEDGGSATEDPAVMTVVADARSASQDYGRNDTDLFDLIEGLRRVVLADELPREDRFDLPAADLDRIQQALIEASPSYFEAAAEGVLGDDAIVANKAGWVPGRDCLDHAYIVDPDTGRRFLLAVSRPYQGGCAALGEIAEIALDAVLDGPGGIPLMADGGSEMDLALYVDGGILHIDSVVEANEVLMFLDGDALAVESMGRGAYRAMLQPPEPGAHVLHITAFMEGESVSHRTLTFSVPEDGFPAGAQTLVPATAS